MNETVGKSLSNLFDFHDEVVRWIDSRKRDILPQACILPENLYRQYRYHTKPIINFQRFSDGFVLFMHIDSEHHNPLMAFYKLMTMTAIIYLLSLAKRTPVRCGIEIGTGTVVENEIYGPVVALAYRLESEVASLPRIVVGNGIKSYLEAYNNQYENSNDPIFKISMESCETMLTTDYDGQLIINALGKHMADTLNSEKDREKYFMAIEALTEQEILLQCLLTPPASSSSQLSTLP